ncbi:unnamed protein product [Hapterophycus canaliculatus]
MSTLPRKWPRGPKNKLHKAAKAGSAARTTALLASGSIDIDEGDPDGWTPLIFAAGMGHSKVVLILLENGANLSVAANDDLTALLVSAQGGHLEATTILIKAGADLAAVDARGATSLHRAACQGCPKVVKALVEAGADVDCRMCDGATALFAAAHQGHAAAVRVLLRANANPVVAALNGHSDTVREFVQEVGIDRCGGASSCVGALRLASEGQYVDTMAILLGAGVSDTGEALMIAAGYGREASVKFLLEELESEPARRSAYASARGSYGRTPLITSIDAGGGRPCSLRVVRMLLNAGADTASTITFKTMEGFVVHNVTPLAFTTNILRDKKIGEKPATEEQLSQLQVVRRLFLQEEAIHASSWLWQHDVLRGTRPADGARSASKAVPASTSLRMTLPIQRRRAKRRDVVLLALFRWVMG